MAQVLKMNSKLLTTFSLRIAIASLVAASTLSACASQRMESPGRAWELVDDREVVGAKSKSHPASDKIVHRRQAVSLSAPVAPQEEQATSGQDSVASREIDGRSPQGWTRQRLVQNWGSPQLIRGQDWSYVSRDGARCMTLRMDQGRVASTKASCP